ncbi:siderophore ABC transporter substrate-binding protein [Arthrobacter flavus]|uniref:Siderophore ABC transporter substrate-binding protein n=1 Tax=Arthrobacter flavus TaxID=95172 RepID=A0ABW4Q3J3_9MICC
MKNIMGRSVALPAAVITAALVLAGCGTAASSTDATGETSEPAAAELTIEHAQGETILEGVPETVITFDMASLDTLDTLGVPVAGLPQDNLPDYLEKYSGADYQNMGTLFEPDYEAVNAAEPDLIIVANRSSEAYAELSKIAPTIDLTLDWEDYLGSFTQNVETLGEVFDKTAETDAALEEVSAKIGEAQSVAGEAGTGLIVMTSAGEITAYGPGSRFGWLHDELGLEPAVADVEAETHGDPVSNEFLLETNPDWLFVIDRDAAVGESGSANAQEVLDNEVVAKSTAWSEDQVVCLDPVPWYIVMSGLTAVNDMVDSVIDGLS